MQLWAEGYHLNAEALAALDVHWRPLGTVTSLSERVESCSDSITPKSAPTRSSKCVRGLRASAATARSLAVP